MSSTITSVTSKPNTSSFEFKQFETYSLIETLQGAFLSQLSSSQERSLKEIFSNISKANHLEEIDQSAYKAAALFKTHILSTSEEKRNCLKQELKNTYNPIIYNPFKEAFHTPKKPILSTPFDFQNNVLQMIIETYMKEGKFQKAYAIASNSSKETQDLPPFTKETQALLFTKIVTELAKQGLFDHAAELLQKMQGDSLNKATSTLALYMIRQGYFEQSKALMKKFHLDAASKRLVYLEMCKERAKQGFFKEALAITKLDLCDHDSFPKVPTYKYIFGKMAQRGNVEQALQEIPQHLTSKENQALVYAHLTTILAKQGLFDQAIKVQKCIPDSQAEDKMQAISSIFEEMVKRGLFDQIMTTKEYDLVSIFNMIKEQGLFDISYSDHFDSRQCVPMFLRINAPDILIRESTRRGYIEFATEWIQSPHFLQREQFLFYSIMAIEFAKLGLFEQALEKLQKCKEIRLFSHEDIHRQIIQEMVKKGHLTKAIAQAKNLIPSVEDLSPFNEHAYISIIEELAKRGHFMQAFQIADEMFSHSSKRENYHKYIALEIIKQANQTPFSVLKCLPILSCHLKEKLPFFLFSFFTPLLEKHLIHFYSPSFKDFTSNVKARFWIFLQEAYSNEEQESDVLLMFLDAITIEIDETMPETPSHPRYLLLQQLRNFSSQKEAYERCFEDFPDYDLVSKQYAKQCSLNTELSQKNLKGDS